MKKILQVALICVLFFATNNTSALTVSKTVRWHGGWCSLCGFNTYGQEYCCAWNANYNYYAGDTNDTAWNCTTCRGYFNGAKYFLDPLPSGATVTGIQVTVCEGDCGDSYVDVILNGVAFGTYYPNGTCLCNTSATFSLNANSVSAVMAGYHLGGMDTIYIHPNTTMCFSTAQIIFTYVLGANLNTFPAQSLNTISYCPGDSIMVPYYAAGSFNNGNVFHAQLSDQNGVFPSTPVEIGHITSTSSGTIHCMIPSNTPITYSNYRIRVVSDNPVVIGTDTVSNITISNASPSITASGPLTICTGSSITLTASTGQSYLWFPGGQTTHSITVSPTVQTIYRVFVANASGCSGTSANDTVRINPVPDNPVAIYGPSSICNFGQAHYSTPVCNNATSYYWEINPSYLQSFPWATQGGDTIIGQGQQTILVEFGNISFAALKVWAVDSCGNSAGYAELDIVPLTGQPEGTWIGGISNSWFNPLNWCGPVPTSTWPETVYINGDLGNQYGYPMFQPVINQDSSAIPAECNNLWLYGYYDTLSIIHGNICACDGSLDIYGDFMNGYLDYNSVFNPNISTVTFRGPGGTGFQDYTSTPAGNGLNYADGGNSITGLNPIPFYNLKINKGTDANTVLDNYDGGTVISMLPGGNLTLINGTLLLSQIGSYVRATGSTFTIPPTSALDLNGGKLLAGSYTIANSGQFILDANNSDDTIGTASGNSIINYAGSSIEIYSGNLKVASSIIVNNASLIIDNVNSAFMSGLSSPAITLNTLATTSNTNAVLDVDATSTMTFNNGTIIFEKASAGTLSGPNPGNDMRVISGSGVKTIGSTTTIQFGDANTPANNVFHLKDSTCNISGNDALYDVILNSYNTPKVILDAPLAISHILYLNNNVMDLHSKLLTMTNNSNVAINRNSGYIIAEDTLNNAAILWKNVQYGGAQYTFPFGNNSGVYIPVKYSNNSTTNTNYDVQIATYAPMHWGHTPYPPTVVQIRDSAGTHNNDSANMVNRFWEITAPSVSSTNLATVEFNYSYAERPVASGNDAAGLRAQRYVSANNGWMSPYQVYSAGGGNGSISGSGFYTVSTSTTAGMVKVSKMNHASPWTLTTSAHPLPIELLNFTAQYNGKTVDLNWATSSELNNDYFIISKTRNNVEFDFVAQVSGAGNSNIRRDYYAEDKSPYTGTSYYKLTQVDFNGNSTQSDLVPVAVGDNTFNIININNDNPNGIIHVYINDNNLEKINVAVYDILGNLMQNLSVMTEKGINHIEINSDHLAKGIYFISVSNNYLKLTGKIAN